MKMEHISIRRNETADKSQNVNKCENNKVIHEHRRIGTWNNWYNRQSKEIFY